MTRPLRLFVALELPEEPVDALVAWRPVDAALRPVPRAALHVTLAFLGAREPGDVGPIARAMREAARPARALSLGAARWLPPRRARVLAVDVADGGEDGALAALQAELTAGLTAALDWTPERRRFLAHVTVARVRSGAVPPTLALDAPPAVGFAATAVTLFRSLLSPHGARYEALERIALIRPPSGTDS